MAWRDKSCLSDPELGTTKYIYDRRTNSKTGQVEYDIRPVPSKAKDKKRKKK